MNTIDTFDGIDDNQAERKEDDTMLAQTAARNSTAAKSNIPEWVTTGEAKRILGVGSVNTIKRWIAEGKLEGRRFDDHGWFRVSGQSIKRLIERGDEELTAIRRLVKDLEDTKCLGGDLSEDDLDTLSERRFGKLPWD